MGSRFDWCIRSTDACAQVSHDDIHRLVMEADIDHDGSLGFTEFVLMVSRLLADELIDGT